jgi:hypothetical protein
MGGKTGFRAYPAHLGTPKGEGIVECYASGFIGHPDDMTDDVRQGTVLDKFADKTPGFGTHHPQDVVQIGPLDDPTPVGNGPDKRNLTKQDLDISDQEVLASIREGRPPRRGY